MSSRGRVEFSSGKDLSQHHVCVIGLGYVGLPTAALLATRGYQVTGIDTNAAIVAKINEGKIHIVEPELDILVKTAVESGRLTARTSPEAADVFVICVPTPVDASDFSADLSYIRLSVQALLPVLTRGCLILLESTSPPGTTQALIGDFLLAESFVPGQDVFVAYCPERVLPGAVIAELVSNDRIVGGLTPRCAEVAASFYETYVQGTVYKTGAKVAETVKLVENTSRDVQIAFANELSNICETINVDVWEVIQLANKHPRVRVLEPGPGVGGHCIAVDPWFLINAAPESSLLTRAARMANDKRPLEVAERIAVVVKDNQSKRVALLGMAYKANIDDCRESPSMAIFSQLRKCCPDLQIMVCEPNRDELGEIKLSSLGECLHEADVIAILVKHKEFLEVNWDDVAAQRTVIDCKGVLRGKSEKTSASHSFLN